MRDLLVHGMRALLGEGAVELPSIDFMYEYPAGTAQKDLGNPKLYGQGFTYAHRLENVHIDHTNFETA